jgi:hypothetical protein
LELVANTERGTVLVVGFNPQSPADRAMQDEDDAGAGKQDGIYVRVLGSVPVNDLALRALMRNNGGKPQ